MGRLLLALMMTLVACGGGRIDRTTEVPKKQPDGMDGQLIVELAETLVKAGAYENALPMIRRALKETPRDPRLHYLMGVILRDRGVYDQAHKSLAVAIELAPQLTPALSAMGMLLDLQGKHAEAKAFHTRAVAEAPDNARFHNNLGFSRYLAGKPAEAEAAYRKGLAVDPTADRLYMNLGFALAAQGREEEAIRMFRQAVSADAARNNLALARELRGDQAAARQMYVEVLRENPSLPQALANLEALESDPPDAPASPEEER